MGRFLLTLMMSILFSSSDAMRLLPENGMRRMPRRMAIRSPTLTELTFDYAIKPPLVPTDNIKFFKVEITDNHRKLVEFVKFKELECKNLGAVGIDQCLYSFIFLAEGCRLCGILAIKDLYLDPDMTNKTFLFNITSAFGEARYNYVFENGSMSKESFQRNYPFFPRNCKKSHGQN